MPDGRQLLQHRAASAILIIGNIVVCCVSLVYCAHFDFAGSPFDPKRFHILYDPLRLCNAILAVTAFAFVSVIFLFARFSFGYFVGFYLYMMVLGYLWLNSFSDLNYNHQMAGMSAAASAVAFLFPALFLTSPMRHRYALPPRALEYLLRSILLFAVVTIAVGASYNFRLVSLENIYDYRDKLEAPTFVNYFVGMTSNALLPFAFACFVTRNDRLWASAVLVLLLLFYPITLSKLTFFAPLWLCFVVLLSKIFEARTSVILSLFVPIFAGVVGFTFFLVQTEKYFATINYRMNAIPSNAMDVYNDFFSGHDLTYFCQISILKPVIYCPYQETLGVVMKKAYDLGNFNGSLFVTEGIASVGPLFAPLIVFICGLIIALGNRLSAGLPPRFILISGAILPQVLLNVPLTTTLLTHGAAALFLLWYITPRTVFEQNESKSITPLH